MRMGWDKLLSQERLRTSGVAKHSHDNRTSFEADYQRAVYSSAVRRLKDKTQVFPLERHDFVRNRLAHSIEVACVGESLGASAARGIKLDEEPAVFAKIVSTACLLHDVGNPPFGHAGEGAMRDWFKGARKDERFAEMSEHEAADFERFDGNAQAFRIATRLQGHGEYGGLNLTAATLAAMMKYPWAADKSPGDKPKFGYMTADRKLFEKVRELTGLNVFGNAKHPLALLVEAADDICYSVADIEDGLKKGVVDFAELVETLLKEEPTKAFVTQHLKRRYDKLTGISCRRNRAQLAYQNFRAAAIGQMSGGCVEVFVSKQEEIMTGRFSSSLVKEMEHSHMQSALVKFARRSVYPSVDIVTTEAAGRHVLETMLDVLTGESREPLIKALFDDEVPAPDFDVALSPDYVLVQRAVDYVAGMTDGYAMRLNARLTGRA
jgi:dGTPase